ncbi:hypothetical protein HG531_000509 [Fusarium graminearum]|nr:hypothetical protein HG531_000509 [Fusarium graminearum]
MLGDLPSTLVIRRIILDITQNAEQSWGVGWRRLTLWSRKVCSLEKGHIINDILIIWVRGRCLSGAMEQSPSDNSLSLLFATTATAIFILGRRGAGEAELGLLLRAVALLFSATLGQNDQLTDAVLLEFGPLSESTRESVLETACLRSLLESFLGFVVTPQQDVVVGCLNKELNLFIATPCIVVRGPNLISENLGSYTVDLFQNLGCQCRHITPLRASSKVGAMSQTRLCQELVVPYVNTKSCPSKAALEGLFLGRDLHNIVGS